MTYSSFSNQHQLKMSIVHIQIALMLVTTKCLTTPTIGIFLDQQQQSNLHDNELYVGQRFCQLEDLKRRKDVEH